jgi:hypothetical protein
MGQGILLRKYTTLFLLDAICRRGTTEEGGLGALEESCAGCWRSRHPSVDNTARCRCGTTSPSVKVLSGITRPLLPHSKPILRLQNTVCRERPTLYTTPGGKRAAQQRLGETSSLLHVVRIQALEDISRRTAYGNRGSTR